MSTAPSDRDGVDGARARARRRTALAGWTLLVLLFVAVRVPPLAEASATYDEPIYLGAGKQMLTSPEPRAAALLYHPPLAYHVGSAALWAWHTPFPAWDPAGPNTQVGLAVLYETTRDDGSVVAPSDVLLAARLPMVAAGLLGLVFLASIGRRLGGEVGAWTAAGAWAVLPESIAHTTLATTDAVAAVAALGLAVAALRHHEAVAAGRPSRGTLVVLGVASGLALLSKHTLLLHVAVVAGTLVALRLRRSRTAGLGAAAVRLAAAAGVAACTVWAGYAFDVGPIAGPGSQAPARLAQRFGMAEDAAAALLSVPIPAPLYLRSLGDALLEKAGPRVGSLWNAYFLGVWSEQGFLLYFPVAFLVKTPVALLALVVAGVAGLRTLVRRAPATAWLCVLLFAVPFVFAVRSRLNIGVRHLLPMTPFALALGAGALGAARDAGRAWAAPAAAGLLAAAFLEGPPLTGDALAFANLPSGGRSGLHRIVADSNLELGQDFDAIVRWAEEAGVASIAVNVHGPPGRREREAARHPIVRTDAPPGAQRVRIAETAQDAPAKGRHVFAVGESILVLPSIRHLLPVAPHARVGRTRLYLLPE